MALNINLNNAFKNQQNIISPVDSNIVLNKRTTDKEIFSDLKLDLVIGEITEKPINALINNNDLLKIKNLESVINSVKNILNTSIGSRLLNPDIEVNLQSYLFYPLSSDIAYFIGDDIRSLIPYYEPRVKVNHISVIPNYNNDCYNITLTLNVPALENQRIDIRSILNVDGFNY